MNLGEINVLESPHLQEASSQVPITVFELLLQGGWMMLPLILLSIASLYIIIERFWALRRAGKTTTQWVEGAKTIVLAGETQRAIQFCQQVHTPIARMLAKGIEKKAHTRKNIEAAIESVGKIAIYELEKNLALLGTISKTAPMIGFLGTVTGMIQSFMAIAQVQNSITPKLLASGIYEAMVTTAVGLIVGIVAYLGHSYMITRLQKIILYATCTAV